MLDRYKHQVCAAGSGLSFILGLWVVLDIMGVVSAELVYGAVRFTVEAAWDLRLWIIAAGSFVYGYVPIEQTGKKTNAVGLIALALAFWAFYGAVGAIPDAEAFENLMDDEKKDLMRGIYAPIAAMIASFLSAIFLRMAVNCAREAGWVR